MTEPEYLIGAVHHFLEASALLPTPGKMDWTELLDLAQAHAMIPMLYTALRDESIPAQAAEELNAKYEQSVQRSLAQIGELARLAGLFERSGIPVVALKGPMLSQYLYGDFALRASGDIDVLVKAEDVLRVREILISNGYRGTNALPSNSRSACLRLRGKEMAFESPSGVSVDVHWRLVPPHFASVFDKLDPWESLRAESLAGRQIPTLSPETQFLFLCVHAAKHMFERLGWVCDIARFMTVTPDLDWRRIVAEARRTQTVRQVSLAVELAAALWSVRVPVELAADPSVEALLRIVRTRLYAGARPPALAPESNPFLLRLFEGTPDRLRFLWGEYVTPSEAEYRVLRLPSWLHFLYYPFRPVRLLWKHGARAVFARE